MKDTKKFFPLFAFYDRTGIENYLEEKAKNGWMLETITGFGWRFRRCEPKTVLFCVTYFPKASAFDPAPTREEETFRDFCGHHGWTAVSQNAQMQVFYNENIHAVPIETDALLETENIHASAKKSFLPSYYILLVNGILQLMMFATRLIHDPEELIVNNVYILNLLFGLLIIALCTVEIVSYFSWKRKATKAAQTDGSFIATKSRPGFQMVVIGVMLMGLGILLASLNNGFMVRTVIYTVSGIAAVTMFVAAMSHMMKKLKVSKSINGYITFISSGLLGVLLAFFLIYVVVSDTGSLGHDPVSSYEYGMFEIQVYNDPIPLKLEDMNEEYSSYEQFSYELYHSSSFLAERYDCSQEPHISHSDEIPSLRYVVYEVKFSPAYDILAKIIYEDITSGLVHDGETFGILEEIPAGEFKAQKAYRHYYRNGEAMNKYLLYYDKNIVKFTSPTELSREDMELIGEKLGGLH